METERTLLKKHSKSVRPARGLKAIVGRRLEENRWLVMEGAKLLSDSPVRVIRLHETVCPMPPFEERVQQMCKQIVACKTEEEAVELVQQLKALLHDRIEHLKGNQGNLKPA